MYLEKLNDNKKLKEMNIPELKILAEEIRGKIIKTVSKRGGHLSANLGAVELTVAIHYVFDLPADKLLFDVGHQCYTHKILSGRNETFDTLRTEGGIAGFTAIGESEYDAFTSGHAGNSLAASLGYAAARDMNGENYKIIDVIGDASFTNGVTLEAFSASETKPDNFVLIVNDNGMSIAKNENGFFGTAIKNVAISENAGKVKDNMITAAGFRKIYSADGNDVENLISVLSEIKKETDPVFLLVKTIKGKGYKEAEIHPDRYHAVGENLSVPESKYAETAGKAVSLLAAKDKRIVAITAGMKAGTGLTGYAEEHKDRFIDAGIAEEYAVALAAGMAAGGLKPFVFAYSTFLQRAYDQIVHDVCIANLPVVFCVNRAGVVGTDGVTHQGAFDLSYLTHIPNMTVLAPKDDKDLEAAINYAVTLNSPVAIRYPSGSGTEYSDHKPFDGSWEKVKDGKDCTILAVGGRMLSVASSLEKYGINAAVYSIRSVKPLDESVLKNLSGYVFTLEENSLIGGFGSAVCEYAFDSDLDVKVKTFGLKDEFVRHASIERQFEFNGLDEKSVSDEILKILSKRN
ncbi:MAG: 1-deoxy-D-xylulose-5-phosphate synthase [Clostridia bacterium]|nr:1-deoxy-D-xylulose-5-phosphate synthase [Clostridia bacterium]